MYSTTRINFGAEPDSNSQQDSLSKYNLRPRKVPDRDTAKRFAVPAMSTRRRQRDTSANAGNIDGVPAPKKIRLDATSSNPVFKATTGAAEMQQSTPVAQKIAPTQLLEAENISDLRNYLEGGHSASQVKAMLLRNSARAGWLEAFDLLLEFGALDDYHQLHSCFGEGSNRTLFQEAIYGGNVALLNRLNAVDGAIHERSCDELKSALIWAILKGNKNIIELLCNAADAKGIHWEPFDMGTFFNAAIYSEQIIRTDCICDIPAITCLTKRYPGNYDSSVFSKSVFTAVRFNHWEAASVLLSVYGASPDVANADGVSLLMMAATAGKYDMYELLRFHDASPHLIDRNGNSVLHHAVSGGNDAIACDLVFNCEVDLNVENNDGVSALQLATSLNLNYIQCLITNAR